MNLDFLKALLTAAAPSGSEARASAVWTQEARGFADLVHEDHYGNVYAEINPPAAGAESQPIALMGHLDEIGLMVSHIDDKGMLAFMGVGGWDPQVLVGQRIRLLAEEGDILGVIGKKAIHVMEGDERSKASKLEDLWIDTALDVDEVKRRISVGTVGVIEQPPIEVNGHLISKALDNRAGAFVVLEALRAMKAAGVTRHVVAVGTSQEEIGCFGAQVSGYRLNPSAGVVVDVTHETRAAGREREEIRRGALRQRRESGGGRDGQSGDIAADEGGSWRRTRFPIRCRPTRATPAPTTTRWRWCGLAYPAAVISIPNRYMHSPNEMVRLTDVQACIDIIAGWVGSLEGEQDYTRK